MLPVVSDIKLILVKSKGALEFFSSCCKIDYTWSIKVSVYLVMWLYDNIMYDKCLKKVYTVNSLIYSRT